MAVLGRLLVSSSERLDLPDLLSVDSYSAGDFKFFLKGLVGSDKPYVLKGFDVIDPQNAIGTQSASIRVANSMVFYPGSNSGSFFHGLEEGSPYAAPLVPELRKNATNYVYLTFSTFNTSEDTRAFWDPDRDGAAGGEFTQDVNTESVLKVDINVSTGSFPANTIPVAKITVGPVVITAIEDARDLMFRLGSGGINPNPFNTYGWRSLPSSTYARQEPPTQMLAGGVNPFQGADKNILTLKEWMDAVMSKLRELGGTTYWYDDTSSFSIISDFYDAVATAFKSKGQWIHDQTTPGLLTWTEDIQIKMTSDPRTYIVRQGSKTLSNEQVMWLDMERNQPFNITDENVQWTNGQPYVNTIGGAVGLFANLAKGDYVKKANDTIDKWVRVEEFYDAVNLGGSMTTAGGARSVRLGSAYLGTTGAEKGRFDKGVYLPADVQATDRNVAGIGLSGGAFHWLALRSDTIESIGDIQSHTLSLAIDQNDGSTARVTASGHGLVDGDRITITDSAYYNGTYKVEVETTDIFYINVDSIAGDDTGNGYFATVTTAARLTPYGFQEESDNHGFASDDTIVIDGTVGFNGKYQINVRNNTTFTIPMSSGPADENTGTATLARIIVRNEGGSAEVVQGEIIDIGGSAADNIRQYIGMGSLSETAPQYSIPPEYNTLDGKANYNGVINENLTVRISKLTAMMADKAQDKTIKILPSNGITSINNTTNGSAQELTFSPDGASITLVTPSSDGQTFVALPDSSTPMSLLVNQAAYITIDRNNPSTPTWTVASIADVPLDENVFVIAVRLSTPDIYIWDGSIIVVGSQPPASYLANIIEQNATAKLMAGGTWGWDGSTLSWSADASIQIPGLADTVNLIPTGDITLTSGEIAYVDINRVAPGGNLTVNTSNNSTLALGANRLVIAREDNGDVIVGNHSMRLVSGESKKLYAGTSDQTITFIGANDEADDAPDYTSTSYISDGDSLVTAISALDAATSSISGSIRWKEPVANAGALPVIGNLDGDVRLTLDTRLPYSWDSGSSTWKPLNGIGGGTKIIGGGTLGLSTVSGFNSGTGFNSTTNEIAVQPDGKILVGGTFGSYNGAAANTIARLNVDGSLDTAFQANVGTGFSTTPVVMVVQPDGKILVGGFFNSYNGTSTSALVRLNSDGTLDNTFTVTLTSASILFIGLQSTGAIIFGGSLGSVNGNTRINIARVSSTGVDDATFYANIGALGSYPRAIKINSDDSFYIAGDIPLAKYNSDGTPNTVFNSAIGTSSSGSVHGINTMSDGSIILSGQLTAFNGTSTRKMIKVSSVGVLDTAFNTNLGTGPNGTDLLVHRPQIDSLNRVTVLGDFTAWDGNSTFGIARVSSTGIFDSAFNTNLGTNFNSAGSTALAVQSDDKILVGGGFTTFNGQSRGHIVRLQSSGLEDPTSSGSILSFTAPIYIEQKGLAYADNTIPVGQSPITFSTNQQAAYVVPNLTAGGPNLTVSVAALSAVPLNAIIVARRDDPGVVIDHTRIISGKTITLDSGVSNQLLSVIPAASEADNTGLARLLANATLPKRVNVTSTIKTVPDGTTYGLQVSSLLMSFTGAQIDFSTGVVYDASGSTPLGVNFTPATIATSQYRWYSVTLIPSTVGANQTIAGQILVVPGSADGATPAAAPRAAFPASGISLGQVCVQESSGSIANIAQSSIVQMGTGGSGGGGTGDTFELLERAKDYLQDSLFEYLTPVIMAQAGETLTDKPNTTATYSIINKSYAFSAASQTFRTVQMLDTDYLTSGRILSSIDLLAFWKYGAIDTAATYEASYDGGANWTSVTMSQIGNTDTFRGTALFPNNTLTNTADLRIRVTSSAGSKEFVGLAVFYGVAAVAVTGFDPYEQFTFSGDSNLTTFTLSKFTPDVNFLRAFDVNTGKVYVSPAFAVSGTTVTFPANTFNSPGETIILRFSQMAGGSYDSSNANAALMAENHLGSLGPGDRSVSGRGILIRADNGDLVECSLQESGGNYSWIFTKVN